MELVTIGEAARRLGLTTSALRYDEERGIVVPAARRSGHRSLFEPLWRDLGKVRPDWSGHPEPDPPDRG